MFIIGNRETITGDVWMDVAERLERENCIGDNLLLSCQYHPSNPFKIHFSNPSQLLKLTLCNHSCQQKFQNCNHRCEKTCHEKSAQ